MSSYISDIHAHGNQFGPCADVGHDWEKYTRDRLAWLYGPEVADQIVEGRDYATRRDLWLWNNLGTPAVQRMRPAWIKS